MHAAHLPSFFSLADERAHTAPAQAAARQRSVVPGGWGWRLGGVAAWAVATAVAPAWAQVPGPAAGVAGTADATPALEAVSVSATRTEAAPFDVPASLDVVGGERIRGAGRPQVNLSESLSLLPGLLARDRQNYAQDLQLSVRGFGARSTFGVRGVRIYVDGIPATMPDGQGQVSHIDLASAGRIEVLRGPYSALYGNSSGGVLQVFTDEGEGPPVVTTGITFGSDGLSRQSLLAAGSTGPARSTEGEGGEGRGLGYVLSASRFATDGWRDHSAARRDTGNLRLDWRPRADDHLTLIANSVDLRADDPLGLTRTQFEAAPRSADAAATLFDTRKTVQQQQVGLTWEHRIDAAQRLRWTVYGGQRDNDQFQAIPVAVQAAPLHPGGVIGLGRHYGGTDLRWSADGLLAGQPLGITAGLAYDALREDRRGWQNFAGTTTGVLGALRRDERNRVSNVDPYLQASWQPTERWTLNAGVRHSTVRFDSADRFVQGANGDDSAQARYRATLPVLGALYRLTPEVNLYATAGRGFETPTLNELAYRPSGATGQQFGLQPSRSTNWEAGAKGRIRPGDAVGGLHLGWTAALFQTDTQDEIVTQTNLGGRSTFQNAGATRRRGAELALDARQGPWRAQLSHGWLDARYRDPFATCTTTPCAVPNFSVPAGNRIPGTSRSTWAAELAWQPARTGWNAGVEARRIGRVFVNDANSDAAPAFVAVAASLGYSAEVGGWTWRTAARVDNLLDRRFAGSVIVNEGNGRFFEPAPGRTLAVSLSGSYRF